MIANNAWQYQGRQQHGWFGSGTVPYDIHQVPPDHPMPRCHQHATTPRCRVIAPTGSNPSIRWNICWALSLAAASPAQQLGLWCEILGLRRADLDGLNDMESYLYADTMGSVDIEFSFEI